MFIQQLRCNDEISELFKEIRVLGPAKPTMKCALQRRFVSEDVPSQCAGWLERHTEHVSWIRATLPFDA